MSSTSHLINGLSIQQAALTNDWDSVRPIFEQDTKLMTKRITCKGETPLMIAVGTNRSHDFVKRLVDRVVEVGDANKLFDTSDLDHDNPLHRAARIGNTTDARVLVDVNPGMTLVPNKDGYRPLNLAAAHGNRRTLRYLLSVTTDVVTEEDGSSPYAGVAGGDLITVTIQAGFLDIAIEIFARHPNIMLEEDKHKRTALEVLGTKPEYFRSGSTLGLWGRLIYIFIPINKRSKQVEQVNVSSVATKFIIGFWNVFRYIAPPIKKIHDIKVKNYQSKLLTEHICRKVIEKADHDTTWKILGSSTYAAVQHGTLEVVKECISTYPDIIWYTGTDEEFHLSLEAITQRQEQVYNLLSESSAHRVYQTTLIDNKEEKENSLHKAAKLAPPHRLNVVTGAALQMQRELQWYKEVENFIDPLLKNALNKDKKSPKTLFIEEHEGLLKEAQDWMKEASASSTVVAALIVTMAFAGAFTIPGGNKDDGKPLFIDKATFMLFIISDAIALFSSTASVLMFLGILTTRFAHDDFLYALPKRMTIGLVSLFTALVTTMIAFSATLVLVLEDKVPWIVAPLVIIACIPIGLLAWLQFPLLIELVWSTYGPSIFRKPKADT